MGSQRLKGNIIQKIQKRTKRKNEACSDGKPSSFKNKIVSYFTLYSSEDLYTEDGIYPKYGNNALILGYRKYQTLYESTLRAFSKRHNVNKYYVVDSFGKTMILSPFRSDSTDNLPSLNLL